MKLSILSQVPSRSESLLSDTLQSYAASFECSELRVAVAYASVAGVMRLLKVLNSTKVTFRSQWLLGLDDYLTQPGALQLCATLPNAELRIAGSLGKQKRFHPKMFFLSSRQSSLICLGSANLTIGGLVRNCESFSAIQCESNDEMGTFLPAWEALWQVGRTASNEDIDRYTFEYSQANPPRGDGGSNSGDLDTTDSSEEFEILENDSPELDPLLARRCWIEVGKNTGKGFELEFKAEQALFFGLSPGGDDGEKQYRNFRTSAGEVVSLPLRYQKTNGMWRLQMNSVVPEVAAGLRPRDQQTGQLGRSPYVAVFDRTEAFGVFAISFIDEQGAQYRELRHRSATAGSIGRTSARRYGWC